ncbi:unnamed protein product [Meloidogyne enterolobii]|uniref:Uncharacterized protein n=1 Tax=Meloidogyne enterolobii TaxID=390850 RepID=A0ACB0Y674_MELEN
MATKFNQSDFFAFFTFQFKNNSKLFAFQLFTFYFFGLTSLRMPNFTFHFPDLHSSECRTLYQPKSEHFQDH